MKKYAYIMDKYGLSEKWNVFNHGIGVFLLTIVQKIVSASIKKWVFSLSKVWKNKTARYTKRYTQTYSDSNSSHAI